VQKHFLSILLSIILLFQLSVLYAQEKRTQTIRGSVKDASIQFPLIGATVVLESDNGKSTLTDKEGNFVITNVTIGRHTMIVTSKGYKPVYLTRLNLESGKELVVSVQMDEEIRQLNEIVVTGKKNKSAPSNALSIISARSFSSEETRRYAAGINDLARIATGFAGVSNNSSDGNAIIIRGNAPNGLLWRLEGVDIPNPNHFARVGTAGGAISILSAQLLDQSDLLMGAFPAEYGNALSGVFDIRFRKGNNQKREFTAAVSTMGVDVATEGYFSKKYKGSYLINYRYNFLSLIQQMGLNIADAPTKFQDLSFNIHLPAGRAGTFSVFGFGGNSRQEQKASRDSIIWTTQPSKRNGWLDAATTGAVGITHELLLNRKTSIRSVVSMNGFGYSDDNNRLSRFNGPLIIERTNRFQEWNLVFSSVINYKVTSKHLIRTGAYITSKAFSLRQRELFSNQLRNTINVQDNTTLVNGFVQWKWDISNRLRFQAGMHAQHLTLNRTSSVAPRMAMRWKAGKRHMFTAGYGIHAQMQPLGNYFARIRSGSDTIMPNKGLDFSKARHFIVGYEIQVSKAMKFKTEIYDQALYHIPVSATARNSFSIINMDDDFTIQVLKNNGEGRNYGMEFTAERAWDDAFYLIASMSLYQSKYLPSDQIWRSTRYNANTGFTLLTGKEWQLGKQQQQQSIAFDLRVMHTGGVRVTPIDLQKSIQQRRTVFDNSKIYEQKLRNFFRIDVQIQWKVQYRNKTGTAILGVQNLMNRKNPVSHSFNAATNTIVYRNLFGILPVFGYRLDL